VKTTHNTPGHLHRYLGNHWAVEGGTYITGKRKPSLLYSHIIGRRCVRPSLGKPTFTLVFRVPRPRSHLRVPWLQLPAVGGLTEVSA